MNATSILLTSRCKGLYISTGYDFGTQSKRIIFGSADKNGNKFRRYELSELAVLLILLLSPLMPTVHRAGAAFCTSGGRGLLSRALVLLLSSADISEHGQCFFAFSLCIYFDLRKVILRGTLSIIWRYCWINLYLKLVFHW